VSCGEGYLDVVQRREGDHYERLARLATRVGARTNYSRRRSKGFGLRCRSITVSRQNCASINRGTSRWKRIGGGPCLEIRRQGAYVVRTFECRGSTLANQFRPPSVSILAAVVPEIV
jgi:hypothetical protein